MRILFESVDAFIGNAPLTMSISMAFIQSKEPRIVGGNFPTNPPQSHSHHYSHTPLLPIDLTRITLQSVSQLFSGVDIRGLAPLSAFLSPTGLAKAPCQWNHIKSKLQIGDTKLRRHHYLVSCKAQAQLTRPLNA